MTADTGSMLQHHRTIFDGWRSISLSLYMTLSGYAVLERSICTDQSATV